MKSIEIFDFDDEDHIEEIFDDKYPSNYLLNWYVFDSEVIEDLRDALAVNLGNEIYK
jgi:hypothetical protein